MSSGRSPGPAATATLCPGCGKTLPPAARSCRYCGHDLVVRRRDRVLDRLVPETMGGHRTPRRLALQAGAARVVGAIGSALATYLLVDELPLEWRQEAWQGFALGAVAGVLVSLRRQIMNRLRGAPAWIVERELRRAHPWWMSESARIVYFLVLWLLLLIPTTWEALAFGLAAGLFAGSAVTAFVRARSLPSA